MAENQKATTYFRPAKWASLPANKEINDKKHVDLPWNCLAFSIGDQAYYVAYLSHPANPEGAEFSERLYGRFGEYFPFELSKENPLSIQYRFVIGKGDPPSREKVQEWYDDYASDIDVSFE